MIVLSTLRWGPNFNNEVAAHFLARLDHKTSRDLKAYLANNIVCWASACSGSDSPAWSFTAIKHALADLGVHVEFPHLASCEIDEAKQEFIRGTSSPHQLFKDIHDLGREFAELAAPSNIKVRVIPCGNDKIWLIGFSCKTMSGLAHDKEAARHALELFLGSTGDTFRGVLMLIEKRKPKSLLLENVLGLMQNGQALVLQRKLKALGYHTKIVSLSPINFFMCQTRGRLWIFCIRMDLLHSAHWAVDSFDERIDKLLGMMSDDNAAIIDIDSLLDPENHPEILEHREQLRQQWGAREEVACLCLIL